MTLWFATTVIALGAFAMPRAHAADLEQLAKRVQVLEDREEIRALILTYGQSHDHRDYKMFASLLGHLRRSVHPRERPLEILAT